MAGVKAHRAGGKRGSKAARRPQLLRDAPELPGRLWAIRRACHLRREDVAALSGVSLAKVKRLEHMRNLATLPLGDVLRVAWALGLAPVELLPGLGVRPSRPRVEGPAVKLARKLAREYRGPLPPEQILGDERAEVEGEEGAAG